MKNRWLLALLFTILLAGCTGSVDEGKTKGRPAQTTDTFSIEQAVMDAYATQPERALLIIDSAEMVGNLTDVRADLLRAKVYARTLEYLQFDTAILIAERLMQNEEVLDDPDMQEEVLEVLLNACRMRKDNEEALRWAIQLGIIYRNRGEETEALRTDAEIGTFLVRVGQQEEGLAKIDFVIRQLDGKRKFNELDASIIALKRKTEICNELGLYDEMFSAAQHMIDLLSDYEQHPADYHDNSIREPSDEDRPFYIDFYRGKAYYYLATAFLSLEVRDESLEMADAQRKGREYLALYEQTFAGQNINGRSMITPLLGKIGEYDRMLAIYDEVEQQMGNDTLNANYAEILRGRAEAAKAQGRLADAISYEERYAKLNETLVERLLQGKAHLYAARFRAQEQQREIERHREAVRRANLVGTAIAIVGVLVLLFAIYAVAQWHKTQRRNRILAQQITEAVEYKAKYKDLVENGERKTENGERNGAALNDAERVKTENGELKTENGEVRTENSQPTPLNSQFSPLTSSDAELFDYLRNLIESEKLYLNPNFERQTLIDRTGLSKERIGAAFAQATGYERLTTLVRELRLDHAVRLLNEQPELTIEQVCQASGFANTVSFNRSFKAKYGMTPSEFRKTKA